MSTPPPPRVGGRVRRSLNQRGDHAPPAHAAPEHRSGWWTGVHFVVGSVTCLSPSYFISRSRYFLLAIRSSLLSTGFCFAIALNNSSACTPAFCTRERDTSTCARGTCEARREEEGRSVLKHCKNNIIWTIYPRARLPVRVLERSATTAQHAQQREREDATK